MSVRPSRRDSTQLTKNLPQNTLVSPGAIPNLTDSLFVDDDDSFSDNEGPHLRHTMSTTHNSMLPPSTPAHQQDRLQDDVIDPDEDVDQQWIELVSTADLNYRIFYNKLTKETTFVQPVSLLGEDGSENLKEMEFLYPNQELTPTEKIRFHLDKINRHVDTCVQIASHTSSNTKKAGNDESETQTTAESLQSLKIAIQQVYGTLVLEETAQQNHKTSVLDYLIGWDMFTWDFNANQKVINYYRACSQRTNHAALQFKQWHTPQYFSNSPLVSGTNRFRLPISIPQSEVQQAKVSISIRRIIMEVSLDDTITSVVAKTYLKFFKSTPTTEVVGSYVLKAQGYNEYFTHNRCGDYCTHTPAGIHDNKLGDFSYIRKCLRDLQEPELFFVRRPDVTADGYITEERLEHAHALQESYSEKINPNIEPVEKHTYSDLIDIHCLSHDELNNFTIYPQSAINVPWHVDIIGAENITPESLPRLAQHRGNITGVYVKAVLIHGCSELSWSHETTASIDTDETVKFNETFSGNAQSMIANLPRETRIAYVLMGRVPRGKKEEKKEEIEEGNILEDEEKTDIPLGWVVNNIINYQGEMLNGPVEHYLWPLPRDATHKKAASQRQRDVDPLWLYRSFNNDNCTTLSVQPCKLYVRYPTFRRPVVAPLVPLYVEPNSRLVGEHLAKSLDKQYSLSLVRSIQSDPLFELTHELKQLIWNCRHYLTDIPSALPKLLCCVDWTKSEMRNEAYRLLSIWSIPSSTIDIIELLDCRYADYQVREYAVNVLRELNDEELQVYLLQLVQCVKYEPYHDSPLSRFLIERAIQCPYQIGHSFYWHLKAEIHDPQYCERFSCIMEELLSHIGIFADELYKQLHLVQKLQKVADNIIRLKREYQCTDEETNIKYHQQLADINEYLASVGKFQIPLNPRWEAKSLIIEKCKYMSSKMVPLWLVFENADPEGPPIYLIFKSGDDLRQDLLTLQILRVMDNLWLQAGLDMRLKPYNVIATGVNDHGEGVGMIEVVLNSTTTSDIQVKYGGGARGALKSEPIDDFIRDHNSPTENETQSLLIPDVIIGEQLREPSRTKYRAAGENFIRSCAGYCVATFVLGVGDRHNGNIMVTKSGHLFHIDFGHFLGNFKKKMGVNRERAALVFTLEMAYAIGGKDFKKSEFFKHFENLATRSFRVLRKFAPLLEILFVTMIGAGMPELAKERDIFYLRDRLCLDLDDAQADKVLHFEVKKSLDSTYRRVDNMIHNMKHAK